MTFAGEHCVVMDGGDIGLEIARELAENRAEVTLIDRASSIDARDLAGV